jgi:molecular chaperone GrpE
MDKEKNRTADATPETPEMPATPETPSETDALREQVAKLERENGELLRHLADYQNRHKEMQAVLKRGQQEIESKLKFAHEKFATDLLTALDNLGRAVDAAKQSGEQSPLVAGVLATQLQIGDVLKRHGITPIVAHEQPFDPNVHQAIQTVPASDTAAPNTVAAVVQQGFMIHDRVLRPAMVVVAQ